MDPSVTTLPIQVAATELLKLYNCATQQPAELLRQRQRPEAEERARLPGSHQEAQEGDDARVSKLSSGIKGDA